MRTQTISNNKAINRAVVNRFDSRSAHHRKNKTKIKQNKNKTKTKQNKTKIKQNKDKNKTKQRQKFLLIEEVERVERRSRQKVDGFYVCVRFLFGEDERFTFFYYYCFYFDFKKRVCSFVFFSLFFFGIDMCRPSDID